MWQADNQSQAPAVLDTGTSHLRLPAPSASSARCPGGRTSSAGTVPTCGWHAADRPAGHGCGEADLSSRRQRRRLAMSLKPRSRAATAADAPGQHRYVRVASALHSPKQHSKAGQLAAFLPSGRASVHGTAGSTAPAPSSCHIRSCLCSPRPSGTAEERRTDGITGIDVAQSHGRQPPNCCSAPRQSMHRGSSRHI